MSRVYNFSAGPAMLPEAVLDTAAAEMKDWHGAGGSIMEMSHRGKEFVSVAAEAELLVLFGTQLWHMVDWPPLQQPSKQTPESALCACCVLCDVCRCGCFPLLHAPSCEALNCPQQLTTAQRNLMHHHWNTSECFAGLLCIQSLH